MKAIESVAGNSSWMALPILLAMAAASCVPVGSRDVLTPAERSEVGASVNAASEIAQAADGTNAALVSQPPTAKSTLETVSVAGCPVLTLSPAGTPSAFNVSLDFNGGCPPPGQTTPVCFGSAAGQIDFSASHVNLTFQALTCGSTPALGGTVDLDYSRADSLLTLTGTWNLTFTSGTEQTSINGPGTVIVDTANQTVTISQFQGQLIRGTVTSNVTANSVVIPLTDNPSLIPTAGTINVSTGLLPRLTIRFNPDSPSTGVVDVSLFGLIFVPVNLNTIGAI